MPDFSPIVLGIDPGARQIGVAVFRGEELVFYAVKSIKKRSEADTLRKLRKVVGKLLAEYRVEFVALEEVIFPQQRRSFVKTVADEIVNFARSQDGVGLFEYHPKFIRQVICRNEKPTKGNVALLLSQRYGELVRYFDVPRLWQKTYYALLFGAIAAGLVCASEIKTKGHRADYSHF